MFEEVRRIVLDEIVEGNEIIVEAKKKFDLGCEEVDVLKAVHFFEEAVDLVPDYLEAWVKLSELYGQLSLWDKAVNCCTKASEIDSGNILVCLRMGDLFHRLEWFDKAICYYEQVLELEADNYLAWFGLASVYKDTQRYMQANKCWEKIIEIIDTRP